MDINKCINSYIVPLSFTPFFVGPGKITCISSSHRGTGGMWGSPAEALGIQIKTQKHTCVAMIWVWKTS